MSAKRRQLVIAAANCDECWGRTYVPGYYEATGYEMICTTCFPEAEGCPEIHSAQQWAKRYGVDSRSDEDVISVRLSWQERWWLQQAMDFERIRDNFLHLLREHP